ncbi:hypothetical protein V2G26_020446 [Clonostachys chloroleuca]
MPLSHVQAGETILYSNCPKILTWFRACLPAYVPPTAASISNGRPQVLRHWYYIIHPSRPPRLDDGEQRSDRYLLRIQTQHAPSSLSSLSTEQCISPARVVAEAGTSTPSVTLSILLHSRFPFSAFPRGKMHRKAGAISVTGRRRSSIPLGTYLTQRAFRTSDSMLLCCLRQYNLE